MIQKNILVIAGPTASGKSTLAMHVARLLDAEIVSADSRQVYSQLTIGTSKPSVEERGGVPHHLLDSVDITVPYSAGVFAQEAGEAIDGIIGRRKVALVVGGSGLYLRALIDGIHATPAAGNDVRRRLYERLHEEGGAALLEELRIIDPDIARSMTPRTTHRIVRALEVYEITGTPLSKHHESAPETGYCALQTGLSWDRAELYRRINDRVDTMIDRGLIGEVRALRAMGYDESVKALQTVGYKEVFGFLRGEYSEAEMVRLIKRNTRRYAKRQLTWFRAEARIHWYPITHESEIEGIAGTIAEQYRLFAPRSSQQ